MKTVSINAEKKLFGQSKNHVWLELMINLILILETCQISKMPNIMILGSSLFQVFLDTFARME